MSRQARFLTRMLPTLLACLLVSSCAYYTQPAGGLIMGASKEDVRALVGPPKSTSRDGSLTTWNYGQGAVCVFKDGQLVASNMNSRAGGGVFMSPPVSPVWITPGPSYYYGPPWYGPAVYSGWWGPSWGWGGGCWR